MRGKNEDCLSSYNLNQEPPHKNSIWPDCYSDFFGNPLSIGSFVIWHPYKAGSSMHIGKIINKISDRHRQTGDFRYVIMTAENRKIERFGWELISYLPISMQLEDINNQQR